MAVSITLERAILKGWASIQASSAAMISGARVMFVGLRNLISCMDCTLAHCCANVNTCAHTYVDRRGVVPYDILKLMNSGKDWPPMETREEVSFLQAMTRFTEAVRKIAFEMPPPNQYTPRFIALVVEAEQRILREADEHHRRYRQLIRNLAKLKKE